MIRCVRIAAAAALVAPSALAQVMTPESRIDSDGYRAMWTAPVAAIKQESTGGVRGEDFPNWTPFGPSGADAESISASPTVPGLVIVGVASAVGGGAIYRSSDSGTTWTLGVGSGNRAVRVVEFSSGTTAWAGTDDGLFRSTDAGVNWSVLPLPISRQAVVRDIAIDPSNPLVVWVGLGQLLNGVDPQVVLRSVDGGNNWVDVSPPVSAGMGATVVALDPANTQRVYAAFTPNFGGSTQLWVSTDGGNVWDERSGGLPSVPLNAIAFGNGRVYVAGGQDFGGQFLGLYTSVDEGMSWTEESAAWPSRAGTALAIDPANPMRIFVGTTRAGLARSDDGGATWAFGVGSTASYQVNDIEFSPSLASTVFLGMGSIAVLRSTDAGVNFAPASNGISRLEITSFAVNPLNSSEIAASYIGVNDGGIFITIDAGATWTLSAAPLPRWSKVYYGPDGTLYGTHNGPLGRAEDGLWRRTGAGPSGAWTNMGPGGPGTLDNIGLDIVATPGTNPVILWVGYRWLPMPRPAQIWSYNRAGTSAWELEYVGTSANEQIFSGVWLDGGAGPRALAGVVNFGTGAGGVLRSENAGDAWDRSESGYQSNWHAWELAVNPTSPEDSAYIIASPNTGMTPGAIFKTIDGGLNWTQQGSNPILRYFTPDPSAEDTLYALAPFNNARPQRSTDDGASFAAFDTNFIPLAGGRDIVHGGEVNGVSRLYVATGAGGFATDLGSTCTADFNDDGDVTSQDFFDFLAAFFSQDISADVNGDGTITSQDFFDFIAAFFGDC